jgi:hypothetical protein
MIFAFTLSSLCQFMPLCQHKAALGGAARDYTTQILL